MPEELFRADTATGAADGADPSVAAVIPTYDYARYLPGCIESLVAQTHAAIDVVVYDDGSGDGSAEAAREALACHRDRFRHALVVSDPRNGGKLRALNVALALVQAPLVSIVDADDVLEPRFFERSLAALRQARASDPSIAFAYSDCLLVDAEGDEICRGASQAFDAKALRDTSYVPDCAPVLTEALRAIMPFDETIRTGTKHHKWLRLVEAGWRGVHVPEPLFRYRMHDRNLSGIGERVRTDMRSGARRERILSRYWGLQAPA